MDQAKLINIYLSQTERYHSNTKGDMILVADMHPAHAANAARVMLNEATQWAMDAGMNPVSNVSLWMVCRPLWMALIRQAQA